MTSFVKAAAALTKDKSGTVTLGGTAQVLMVSNSERSGFWVQNVSAGDLWISEVGTAAATQPSLKIAAGGMYETPMTGCPRGSISIFGTTTSQAFSAREW